MAIPRWIVCATVTNSVEGRRDQQMSSPQLPPQVSTKISVSSTKPVLPLASIGAKT